MCYRRCGRPRFVVGKISLDTQTNLLLNGWNSIAHAAHTMCDVYNIIIMYTTQPEETFDVNKYNHKTRRSVKVRFIFDYKTTTVVVKRRF